VQGSLIGLWGCFLGVAIGVPVALYAPSLVAGLEALLGMRFLNSEIYPIDYLPTDLQVRDVLMVVGVALALNFVATLDPAWRAARVRPAEVLRYEWGRWTPAGARVRVSCGAFCGLPSCAPHATATAGGW